MIAHVQLHDFFVAVERSARADLDGRPLLIGGPPGGRGAVAVASEEARDRGVHTGMSMRDAVALVPDAICVPGAIERYLEVSAQIDERLRRCTRSIEWAALDEAYLRIEGPRPSHTAALDDVRDVLARDFGMQTSVGIGSTKAVAAMASRLMQPSGMLIVLPGYESRALALDDRPLAPAEVPKGIARASVYGTCGGTQARGAIARLAEQAALALRRSGHAARQVRLRVRDHAGERMRVHRADPPIASDHEVIAMADTLAQRLLHPGRELHEAAIFLTALTPVEPQLQLFDKKVG